MREKKAPRTTAVLVGVEWQATCPRCQAVSIAPTQQEAEDGLTKHNAEIHKT